MENLISCYLMGGLGNQLFQIFTTYAYGKSSHRKVIFPYTDILTTGRPRPTYWGSFLKSIARDTTVHPEMKVTNADLMNFTIYKENGFEYKEISPMFQTIKNVILYGYFQSYKYFDDYKTDIMADIECEKHKEEIKEEYSFLLDDVHTISMHFRLGDYKLNPDCHPIMPYEYYRNALRHILTKRDPYGIYRVLYFCEKEDNQVVQVMINDLKAMYKNVDFIKVDDTIEDWKQLLLMSCCNDNIIANSSFSWWGGYFNANADKIVCYPRMWFGPGIKANTDDLFPQTWKKIAF